ncbi:MAG TPA: protein phosphatase 2C domain-containing protein [Labilithrix sp.]|nr:protein phosphatase 2C domain-containing protein [Labilithrix sp.]
MTLSFDIAGGSIAGEAHVAAGRNNQDAFCWGQTGLGLVAVVCDGCGGAAHSDVGAKVGARLIVEAVRRRLGEGLEVVDLLERARVDVVAHLRTLAAAMSVEAELASSASKGAATRFATTVADHFLFTVVGVLVAGGSVTTFALGDGLVVVNGHRRELGPYPNNEPPYLGYGLLDAGRSDGFEVHPSMNVADVRSLLIGTDGVLDVDATNERELDQFWEDDRIFRNADMVRRRLSVMSRARRGSSPGRRADALPRLADDTTLVVIRRREERRSS